MSWKTKTWFCLLVLLKVFTQKSSRLGGPSLNLSILGNMDLQNDVTFQNLACQVLNKKIRNSFAKSWLTIIFLWSCLGRPRHENHNSSLGLMLKLITPKGFNTWKAKSWKLQSMSRLGNMELQKCSISKLGIPSLEQKNIMDVETWSVRSWQLFSLVFMSRKTKPWKTLWHLVPQKVQDLEYQVLICQYPKKW